MRNYESEAEWNGLRQMQSLRREDTLLASKLVCEEVTSDA